MPLSRNLFLRYKHFIANRAMFAFGLAGCGASSCNSFVDHLGMTLGGNLSLCNDDRVADGAMLARGLAGRRTGRRNSRIDDLGVAGGIDCFGLGLVADCAGVGLNAGALTGGSGCDLALIPAVALGGNNFLLNEDFVADRAVLTLGLAGRRTGRLNRWVNDLGVALGGDFLLCNENLVTGGAVLALGQTRLRAGRLDCRIDDLGMTRGGNHFQAGEDRITNGALRTGLVTSLGAGSGLFRNFNRSMSSCVDCFGLGCIANCAGESLDTGVLTGRSGRDLALVPLVALGGNLSLCNDDRVADGAVLAFGQASLGAGRLDPCVNDLGVSLGGDDLAILHLLFADGAVGIAGVAILSAGGLLGISHFRVLMCASFAAPDAVDIVDGVASLGGRSFGVGAVGVVQLGGGDGN